MQIRPIIHDSVATKNAKFFCVYHAYPAHGYIRDDQDIEISSFSAYKFYLLFYLPQRLQDAQTPYLL